MFTSRPLSADNSSLLKNLQNFGRINLGGGLDDRKETAAVEGGQGIPGEGGVGEPHVLAVQQQVPGQQLVRVLLNMQMIENLKKWNI